MDQNKELWDIVDKLNPKYTNEWFNLNYMLIPVTVVNADIGNETIFNEIYQWLLKSNFNQITRTKSGGISISSEELFNKLEKYDVEFSTGCCEITICTPERSCRIQFRINNYKTDEGEYIISGRESFNIFLKQLKRINIDINKYIITKEEGIELNKTIHKPDIRLIDKEAVNPFYGGDLNKIYENAFHIDFHKFYMSGLKTSHPEFAPAIDILAEKAKSKDEKTSCKYKTIMAATIGYSHSKYSGYKYTKLAKDAINTAYKKFDILFEDLINKGYNIIATNTDGIWVEGPTLYHNKDLFEGEGLEHWSIDHKNCRIRFKSAGSYEYIEDDKYHPVVRGRTRLDAITPRDQWKWGDIFLDLAEANRWTFEEGVGIIWEQIK